MSLKSKISSTFTLAFAVVAFATFASAQDAAKTEDKAQKFERGEHHRGMRGERGGRHDGMRGGMFGLRGIELTDAQKEQIRQIHEANKPTEAQMAEMKAMHEARKSGAEITEAQREQMKAYREQMRAKHESVKAQILAILTPEQRQQLEARKAEREKRREEFRQQRQERKATKDAAKPTDNNYLVDFPPTSPPARRTSPYPRREFLLTPFLLNGGRVWTGILPRASPAVQSLRANFF